MNRDIAGDYIRENFQPNDRLAVVVINRRTGTVTQRLAKADKIAASDFQAWLRHKNAKGHDIFISMNALAPTARGRTKQEVETIRHLYLDFDEDGTVAVQRLLSREDVPKPNYLLNTSPDKWQAVWKVEAFGKDHAEILQKGMTHEFGADPAATDCARVLRLPGFSNNKYGNRPRVAVQALTTERYRPEHFPKYPAEEHDSPSRSPHRSERTKGTVKLSQSERDWAYAKRALARGENERAVIEAIILHRSDKANPRYYAELTVSKAAESLRMETPSR